MVYVASKLFWLFAEPSNLFVILLGLGALLLFTRWRRLGRWVVAAMAIAAVVIGILPVGQWLLVPLEDRFPSPVPMPEQVDGVIVLGGGVSTYLSEVRGQPSLNEHAERLVAMVGLALKYPYAKVIYTGGGQSLLGGDYREADAARAVLAELGMDTKRVIFERESRNTFQNVLFSKKLAQPARGETWLLVTSAWHMPRAVGIFRQQGWPVIPYPVDYLTDGQYHGVKTLDFNEGLGLLHRSLKEWIGLAAYRWLGYTDSLFPGPQS